MKLRKWVKVTLVVIALGSMYLLLSAEQNNAINKCVNSGHDRSYCEIGLR